MAKAPKASSPQLKARATLSKPAPIAPTLQRLLPAGAARNALDCALWDLEAKLSGVPAHVAAGFEALSPLVTAFTISLGAPDQMRAAAERAADRPLLKIKLAGEGDEARLAAVRAGAPNSALIVDANEVMGGGNPSPPARRLRRLRRLAR